MYIDNGPWTRNSKKNIIAPKVAEKTENEILKDYSKMA